MLIYHYNGPHTNKLYYDCLCATELGISFIQGKNVMKYHVIKERYKNDNTAEFGFGDFPERTPYIALTVEAETRRKAMNKAKKIDHRLSFSGMFGDKLFSEEEWK